MPIQIQPRTIPPAGIDIVEITLHETYSVEGIGEDTLLLKGELEAHRGAPLLGHGQTTVDWAHSTVVAQFTSLSLSGNSEVFGPVRVTLNRAMPSFGMVSVGKCQASMALRVTMPEHGLVLNSAEPVQLHSTVETVPPIGDEKTESVVPVDLVEAETSRVRGKLVKATVAWRDLLQQKRLVAT